MRELDDVKSLFAEIGVSGSSYKEIARDDLARESLSRWPLLSTVHETAAAEAGQVASTPPAAVPVTPAPLDKPAFPAAAVPSSAPAPAPVLAPAPAALGMMSAAARLFSRKPAAEVSSPAPAAAPVATPQAAAPQADTRVEPVLANAPLFRAATAAPAAPAAPVTALSLIHI